jgi:hypothetical protein
MFIMRNVLIRYNYLGCAPLEVVFTELSKGGGYDVSTGKLAELVCMRLRFSCALHCAYVNTDMTSAPLTQSENTRRIFTLLTGFMALRFTATGAPLAVRRIRILQMNQHA